MLIRSATQTDTDAIWAILEPIIRAGETYPLPRDMSRNDAFRFWFAPAHEVFVAEDDAQILGTYFLRPNQLGGGAHVCNCGYMTAPSASGSPSVLTLSAACLASFFTQPTATSMPSSCTAN